MDNGVLANILPEDRDIYVFGKSLDEPNPLDKELTFLNSKRDLAMQG